MHDHRNDANTQYQRRNVPKLDEMNHHAISIKADIMELYNYLLVFEDILGHRPFELSRTLDSISESANQIYQFTEKYSDLPEEYEAEEHQ